MIGNLAIASTIDKRINGKAYDHYCKMILSNKQVLAHIMKECISEFAVIPLKKSLAI